MFRSEKLVPGDKQSSSDNHQRRRYGPPAQSEMRDSVWSIGLDVGCGGRVGLCEIENFSAIGAIRKMRKCLLALRTPERTLRKRRERIGARVWPQRLPRQAGGNEFVKAIHRLA